MRVEKIEEKLIYGITTRTKNSNEMDPVTSKIADIWKEFHRLTDVNYKNFQRLYGVYYNYEADENGEFCVLAGCDVKNYELETVTIEAGVYLVFSQSFEPTNDVTRVEAIIKTWGRVWDYFLDTNSQYKRAFITDFEYYKNENEIEIYISIK